MTDTRHVYFRKAEDSPVDAKLAGLILFVSGDLAADEIAEAEKALIETGEALVPFVRLKRPLKVIGLLLDHGFAAGIYIPPD